MADPLVITTLHATRAGIENTIATVEDRLEQARADLAHVNATIRLFELRDTGPAHVRAYMSLNRVFARGELRKLCKEALTAAGRPLTTRELTDYVIQSKGLDGGRPDVPRVDNVPG